MATDSIGRHTQTGFEDAAVSASISMAVDARALYIETLLLPRSSLSWGTDSGHGSVPHLQQGSD